MARVFVSYSHDSPAHRDAVRAFADGLRAKGHDAWIDLYAVDPDEGWARWMQGQIDAADFILIVPTETYLRRWKGREEPGKGRGATWEGLVLTNRLYQAHGRARGLRAVLVGEAAERFVPDELGTHSFFRPPDDDARLEAWMRGLPSGATPPPLGALSTMVPAWSAAAPPSWNPRMELSDFLLDRFTPYELVRMMSYGPRGKALRQGVPDPGQVAPLRFVEQYLDTLDNAGELGTPWLWELLRRERPLFVARIDTLEAEWR